MPSKQVHDQTLRDFKFEGACSVTNLDLIFVCPRIASVTLQLQPKRCNYFFDYLFLKCSTCFRRSLRPSSGAHNRTFSYRCCQPILLQAGIVDETLSPVGINIGALYQKLYIQSKSAPGDGQVCRPKHVELI